MKLNFQSPPGQPGSFPLPNSGEPGQPFMQGEQQKIHPAARRAQTGTSKQPVQTANVGGSYGGAGPK